MRTFVDTPSPKPIPCSCSNAHTCPGTSSVLVVLRLNNGTSGNGNPVKFTYRRFFASSTSTCTLASSSSPLAFVPPRARLARRDADGRPRTLTVRGTVRGTVTVTIATDSLRLSANDNGDGPSIHGSDRPTASIDDRLRIASRIDEWKQIPLERGRFSVHVCR